MSPGTSLKSSMRKHGRAFDLLGALLFEKRDNLLRRAVHRVVQIQFLQGIFVLALHRDGDFFDGADLGVVPGLVICTVGASHFARFDEIVVGQANQFAMIHDGDVIRAVFFDGNGRDGAVVLRGVQTDRLAVSRTICALASGLSV